MIYWCLILSIGFILLAYWSKFFYIEFRFKQRLKQLLGKGSRTQNKATPYIKKNPKQHYDLVLQKFLNFLTLKLKQCGWHSKKAPKLFCIAMILGFIIILSGSVWILINNYNLEWTFINILSMTFMVLIFQYFLTLRILNMKMKHHKAKLTRELPDFFILFLIYLESGYGNKQALKDVLNVLKYTNIEASIQIALLLDDLEILPNEQIGWKNFAQRIHLKEITALVEIIVESQRLGTPMTDALRRNIKLMEDMHLMMIDKKINKLPGQLAIISIVSGLPLFLLVILGPALIKYL